MLKTLFALIGVVLAIQSIPSAKACTLTGTWQDVQVIGAPSIDDNFFTYDVRKNPIDGTLWFHTWGGTDLQAAIGPAAGNWRLKIYKQVSCNGKFILDNIIDPTPGRYWGYAAMMDFDAAGNLYVVLDETNYDVTIFYRVIKKRTPAGVWSTLSTLEIPTNIDIASTGMTNAIVRDTSTATGNEVQVWALGWTDHHDLVNGGIYQRMEIWKWKPSTDPNGTWTSFDLHGNQTLVDGNYSEGNLLRKDPTGKIWAAGRQEMDGFGDYVHALLWVEKSYNDPNGFDLKIDYRQNPGTGPFDDSWDRFRDVAFSPDGTEYRMTHTSVLGLNDVPQDCVGWDCKPKRSRIFKGTVANPSAYTIIDDSAYSYIAGSTEEYSTIVWHPNGQLIISASGQSTPDYWHYLTYSHVRMGSSNGPFTTSLVFSHPEWYGGSFYRDPYVILDNSQNLWAIGSSLNDTNEVTYAYGDGRIYIRKMLCQ